MYVITIEYNTITERALRGSIHTISITIIWKPSCSWVIVNNDSWINVNLLKNQQFDRNETTVKPTIFKTHYWDIFSVGTVMRSPRTLVARMNWRVVHWARQIIDPYRSTSLPIFFAKNAAVESKKQWKIWSFNWLSTSFRIWETRCKLIRRDYAMFHANNRL